MQELEAKFLAVPGEDAGEALRRFQQSLVWAGFRVQPAGRRTVTDTYFDTADQQLRSAGWSYRQRRRNGSLTATLKELNRGRGAVFDREEIEQPLPADTPGDDTAAALTDGPVRRRLETLLQPGAVPARLFAVCTQRSLFRLTHPDYPRAVIDMALDDARIEAPDPLRFTEVELELSRGPHELLAAAIDVADLEPALVAARLSKFQRGLMAAGCPLERRSGPQTRHLDGRSRWLDLALAHLKSLFYQIKLYEPYAWEGVHSEGVHQMRVATRRTRAALETFADVLPAAEQARLVQRLRWLAGRLGAVRDLDVQLAHVAGYHDRVPPAERVCLDRYRARLEARHRQARCELLEALDGSEYLALVSDFRHLLGAARRPEHAVATTVDEAMHTALPPLVDAVLRRGRGLENGDATAKDLHRLRIRVKRLRYRVEFLEDVVDHELDALRKPLQRLQSRLGTHQDAVVARAELAAFGRAHPAGKRQRRMLERLDRREKQRARRARKRCRRAWRGFRRAAVAFAAAPDTAD